MQDVTKRTGLVTGDDLPALLEFLFYPVEEAGWCETLRRLGMRTIFLRGADVSAQVDVDGNLEQRFGLSGVGNTVVFICSMHMGRHGGSRVRPLSALMFSNHAAANPAGALCVVSLASTVPSTGSVRS